jgi:small subunit ribosomal protein S8e
VSVWEPCKAPPSSQIPAHFCRIVRKSMLKDMADFDLLFQSSDPGSWVSLVTAVISARPLVRSGPITARRGGALSLSGRPSPILIALYRAFEKGRQPANTRIGPKRIHLVRTRGGNTKYRALRIDSGNFSWGSEGIARKVRVIAVSYHPSNNELVRTNTLTKSAVVQIDAAPFRQWYEAHYGASLGRRRQAKAKEGETAEEKKSKSVEKKHAKRLAAAGKIEPALERQFEAGRLYAVVASRPGQSGRVDGYVLEGEELAFYQRALRR